MKTSKQNAQQRPFPSQEALREYVLSNFKYLSGNIDGKYSMHGKEGMLLLKREFGNQIQLPSSNISSKSLRNLRPVRFVGTIVIADTDDNRQMIKQKVSV